MVILSEYSRLYPAEEGEGGVLLLEERDTGPLFLPTIQLDNDSVRLSLRTVFLLPVRSYCTDVKHPRFLLFIKLVIVLIEFFT